MKRTIASDIAKNLDSAELVALNVGGLPRQDQDILLSEIRREGSLLIMHLNPKREALRDSFVEACRKCFSDSGILADFEAHLVDARRFESAFRGVKQTLKRSEIANETAARQGWGVISAVSNELSHVKSKVEAEVKPNAGASKEYFDPTQIKLTRSDGTSIAPEAVENALVAAVGTTLGLLAYENGWYTNGELILPKEVAVDEELVERSKVHLNLAIVWRRLVRAWDSCRLFANNTESHDLPFKDDMIEVIACANPPDIEKHSLVASNRLERQYVQLQMQLFSGQFKEASLSEILDGTSPIEARNGISINEAATIQLFEEAFHIRVDDAPAQIHGLPIKDWIRGYALLAIYAEELCEQDPKKFTFTLDIDRLRALLQSGGIAPECIEGFIRIATYDRNAIDLYDAPIIKVSDGSYRFCAPCLLNPILSEIILSRIRTFGSNHKGDSSEIRFADKGSAFEQDVLQMLLACGTRAASFKYRIDEKECECDAAAVIGNKLFIFECKNYTLPLNHKPSIFYHEIKLKEAAQQVLRIAADLNERPEIIREHLGEDVSWDTVVPVVLQALPWSSGKIDDVYFYDGSAFGRYITGEITIHKLTGEGVKSAYAIKLRPEGNLIAEELIAEMTLPRQLAEGLIGWEITAVPLIVDERLLVRIPELSRRSVSIEETLKAWRATEEEIHAVSAGDSAERAVREQLHLILTNTGRRQIKIERNEPCPCGGGLKYKKCCGKVIR